MIAERIRCTEADLRAAYRIQGLRPANGPVDGPAVAASISPDSGLVGNDGSLTATTRMVLPVLARPERIISVSAVTVGQNAVDSAMILAPYGGGPFVLRGDRDGQVDLVALDSPTAAVSLLDEMMVITGPPTTSATADVHIDHVTWLGLLAAADAQRAARLESQLERGSDTAATFNAARLEHLIDQALDADDTRWILGAEALVDRAFVEHGKGMGQEALSGLVTSRLAEPVAGNMAVLTDTGRLWAEMLSTFVRLSHLRILHVIDGAPTDIIGMTFFRSPTDVAVAQIGSNAVTIMSLNADVAAATLRAALEGTAERDIDTAPTPTTAAAPSQADTSSAEWAYVLDPVEVRGLYDTAAIVGTLQPGTWYLRARVEGGWAHVADADGSLEGWAPAAGVHGQSEPPPLDAPLPAETSPAWSADHMIPPEGAPMWVNPDPATPAVGSLAGGMPVRVIEVLGAWARVQTETGTDGWVDGRRLVPVATESRTDHNPPAAAPTAAAPPKGPADPVVAIARSKPVQLVAALAVAVSAFLPWFGDLAPTSDLPVAFLWSLDPVESLFSIALLILVVGIGAVGTVLAKRLSRYQRAAGGIAAGIAAVWLIQTFRTLMDWSGGGFGSAMADMFTDVLSIGPWVALAAGIVLLVKR